MPSTERSDPQAMVRNVLSSALRHLARNRLYSAISVLGLAIGVWLALTAALEIRTQFGYEHFIPGYPNIFYAVHVITPRGHASNYVTITNARVASLLKLRFSEVRDATRLLPLPVTLRRGEIEANEVVYWADPNAFEVLPLPTLFGDATTALQRPDGIAISLSTARKYFGRDNPVGETLFVDGSHVMTVRAVLADPPLNATHLQSGIFASGLAAFSRLALIDKLPENLPRSPVLRIDVETYLRLAPGASIDRLQAEMPALMREIWPLSGTMSTASLRLLRLDRVHTFAGLNPSFEGKVIMLSVVALFTLLIACFNFINLMTARAAHRALEVAIRKTSGASRRALITQFLGESLLYVAVATLVAVALAEWSLPAVNAFLNSGAHFDYWHEPALIGWVALAALGVGILAGAYPAFVLSAFRPVPVLKGWISHSSTMTVIRQSLVTVQFAVLIVLLICTGVLYQQHLFALRESLRLPVDQMLIVASPCNPAFIAELRSLSGVRGTACASLQPLGTGGGGVSVQAPDGSTQIVGVAPVEFGVFELYGLKPIAGRLPATTGNGSEANTDHAVINETAAHRLGFTSAAAAIGRSMRAQDGRQGFNDIQIVGVIPDFVQDSVQSPIPATAWFYIPQAFDLINVKLTGHQIPETLAAIDRLWRSTGGTGAINRYFLDERIQDLYLDMERETLTFGAFSIIAVLLACVGLLGLSASAADRRTREIGVRKAMGADTSDIVRLLLWQFSQPVLWASLLAWPIAALAMRGWLHSFAYHVDLDARVFAAAAVAALGIALLTVGTHSLRLAQAKPVAALRYE
jgi:putative ABC transport system permease protein